MFSPFLIIRFGNTYLRKFNIFLNSQWRSFELPYYCSKISHKNLFQLLFQGILKYVEDSVKQ